VRLNAKRRNAPQIIAGVLGEERRERAVAFDQGGSIRTAGRRGWFLFA
jgi:hypothetical protein